MELEFSLRGNTTSRRLEEQPFRILVLGNFSGGAAAAAPSGSIAKRRIAPVDFERLESLWSLFSPGLELDLGPAEISFAPRDIDDFHPDRLYESLPIFEELRATRKSLLDPKTAQETLDALLASGTVEEEDVSAPARDDEVTEAAPEGAEGMFERLLGKPSDSRRARRAAPADPRLERYIRKLVAPHIVEQPDPRVETAVDSLDLAISDVMRGLLHHAEFQALESAWRSLHEMVAQIELDETLQLFACDIRREELLAGLPEPESGLDDCELFGLLVNRRQAADDPPWTVIAGDYSFSDENEDIALMTALGAAAAANGGVFLGGASMAILGCEDVHALADPRRWQPPAPDALWQALRKSEIANRIGLALPRVLARLPYGEQSDPTERFDFEEMPRHNHGAYLWANPVYACARLLAEGFTREGWRMSPGSHVDLGPLPAHTYTTDGETHLQPCAEVLIPESAMVAMLEQGLMPLVSYRNRNTAAVGRFQSIASPPAALAGPWAT